MRVCASHPQTSRFVRLSIRSREKKLINQNRLVGNRKKNHSKVPQSTYIAFRFGKGAEHTSTPLAAQTRRQRRQHVRRLLPFWTLERNGASVGRAASIPSDAAIHLQFNEAVFVDEFTFNLLKNVRREKTHLSIFIHEPRIKFSGPCLTSFVIFAYRFSSRTSTLFTVALSLSPIHHASFL